MGDRNKGLLRNEAGNRGKFIVQRTDGRDASGEKHYGCDYFVLDLTHDLHARRAAMAYADSAERDGYELLAADLRELVDRNGGRRDIVRYPDGDLTKPVPTDARGIPLEAGERPARMPEQFLGDDERSKP